MSRRGSFEKPANTLGTMKQIRALMRTYRWKYCMVSILTVVSEGLSLYIPVLIGMIIDQIEQGYSRPLFNNFILLLSGIYLITSVFGYLISVLIADINRRLAARMRGDMFKQILNSKVDFFMRYQSGDIISRIYYDVDIISRTLIENMTNILSTIVLYVGTLFILSSMNPIMLMPLAVFIPVSVILTMVLSKKIRKNMRVRSVKIGSFSGFANEKIIAVPVIFFYACEKWVMDIFTIKNKQATKSMYDAELSSGYMMPTITFLNNITFSIFIIICSILNISNVMSIGMITVLILYSRRLFRPISEISNNISDIFSSLAAAERYFEIMNEPAEEGVYEEKHNDGFGGYEGQIAFENVSFGYSPHRNVIKNVDFKIESGKTAALVGATGAGKTTIANLLMRYYTINGGMIRIGENDFYDLPKGYSRKMFSMVLQEPWVFNGTIYENMTYGNPQIKESKVFDIARKLEIHDFIAGLENGYFTEIKNNTDFLSRGQKQLLCIARAMLCETRYLILDEATANIDILTEHKIQKAMKKLMDNKTCMVIAHRLSTIQNADKIIVIDKGEVVQQGSHKELITQEGKYKDFYEAQFKSLIT